MGLENPLHILIILVVLLLVFGAKKLPEIGKGMGSGMRGFKDALMSSDAPEPPAVTAAPPAVPTTVEATVPTPVEKVPERTEVL